MATCAGVFYSPRFQGALNGQTLFRFMLENGYPRTSEQAAYGTPEIAEETVRLVRDAVAAQGIFVMAGHEDGVVAYGADIESARQTLLEVYHKTIG